MKIFGFTHSISRSLAVLGIFVAITVSGCDTHSLEEPGLSVESERAGNGRTSRNTMYTFTGLSPVGTTYLRRNNDAVAMIINTSELKENYAYTAWWVIFDRPEFCTPPGCSEDDIFEDALAGGPNKMEVSILGAADGSVVGADGHAYYRGKLAKDDARGSVFGDGLDNPRSAEIHFVIRSHGPAIPGLVRQQVTTFNGGCEPGQPNEGQCVDVQFAIHQAAN